MANQATGYASALQVMSSDIDTLFTEYAKILDDNLLYMEECDFELCVAERVFNACILDAMEMVRTNSGNKKTAEYISATQTAYHDFMSRIGPAKDRARDMMMRKTRTADGFVIVV